jgi:glycosyltransferase involved in cell wall biosynthesis
MRRRILFLNTTSVIGGQEVVLLDIVRGLDPARFESVLATIMPGALAETIRAEGKPVYLLPPHRLRQPLRFARAIAALARILDRERIDVVHCNGDSLLLYGALAAARRRLPCVWHVYEPVVRRGNAFVTLIYETQRWLHPAWTIFGTAAVEESYRRDYPRLGNCTPIMPGVDADELVHGADAERARRRFGLPNDTPLFLVVGRLQRTKGQNIAIAALSRLAARTPAPHLVLCGGPPIMTDEDYPDELRSLSQKLGVAERVHFVGGVTEAEKRDLLQAATALVHPALREAFGIVVVEGMATAKPVIVTDCVGPSSIVQGSGAAEVVPRGDVEALAGAMSKLLDDPARARRLGELGRTHVRAHYDRRQMVQNVEAIYDQVLERR